MTPIIVAEERNRKIRNTWKAVFVLFSIPPILEIFYWFNPHHDGLVISTIKGTKLAWENASHLPFNQYGPFWSIPYTLLTWFVPQNWMLHGLRFVALICYVLSAALLWKIARRITSKNTSFFLLIIFAASQPFFSGLGMMPWPSSIAMPLFGSITFLMMNIVSNNRLSDIKLKLYSLLIGVLVICLLGTRVQIGLLLLPSVLMILCIRREFRLAFYYIAGVGISMCLFAIYLSHFGSLKEALFDEFYYGSLYLKQGSVEGYGSKPIFTTAGIIFFCFIFFSWDKVIKKLNIFSNSKIKTLVTILLFFLVYSVCFLIVYPRNTDLLFAPTVISRRFWSALIIASIIFVSIAQLITLSKLIRDHKKLSESNWVMIIVVLFSLIGITQAWPLFDASHTWWGAIPGIVLVSIVIRERLIKEYWTGERLNHLIRITASLLIIFTIVLDIGYFTSSDNRRISSNIIANLRADSLTVKNEETVQEIFTAAIPPNSVVLNLCPNSDVYINELETKFASRLFVFWPNFKSIKNYMDEIYESKPEFIVYCSSPSPAPIEHPQKQIIEYFTSLQNLVGDQNDDYGQRWRIWRVVS